MSRSSKSSDSKLPRVNPTNPPPKVSGFVFDEVDVADAFAGEAIIEFGVISDGFAAVSAALFSKLRSSDLIDSAFPCSC